MERTFTLQYAPLCTMNSMLVLTGKSLIKIFNSTHGVLELEVVTTWTQPFHLTCDGAGAKQLSNLPKVTKPDLTPHLLTPES